MSFDFPEGLLEAQDELNQARAALTARYEQLPWSVAPQSGWTRTKEAGGGYYESQREDSPGWTEAEQEEIATLRARVLELSERIVTHDFWSTCEDAPAARSALKHARS
ncbi:hypothetical protein [Streptomyces sp. NPDC093097]|uniref:hypothetical protein n=1 Tax=Streptomyces sp. NPDC093097 TaxID=3366027 RepID=UPI0038247A89